MKMQKGKVHGLKVGEAKSVPTYSLENYPAPYSKEVLPSLDYINWDIAGILRE